MRASSKIQDSKKEIAMGIFAIMLNLIMRADGNP